MLVRVKRTINCFYLSVDRVSQAPERPRDNFGDILLEFLALYFELLIAVIGADLFIETVDPCLHSSGLVVGFIIERD